MKDFYLFDLKTYTDERGSLVSLVDEGIMPFEVKRIYYIVNSKTSRGKLAHKRHEQVIVCISGSCKVLLDDGKEKNIIELSKFNQALFINKGIWREMYDFSPDCVLVSVNNDFYSDDEVIRDYDEFLNYRNTF